MSPDDAEQLALENTVDSNNEHLNAEESVAGEVQHLTSTAIITAIIRMRIGKKGLEPSKPSTAQEDTMEESRDFPQRSMSEPSGPVSDARQINDIERKRGPSPETIVEIADSNNISYSSPTTSSRLRRARPEASNISYPNLDAALEALNEDPAHVSPRPEPVTPSSDAAALSAGGGFTKQTHSDINPHTIYRRHARSSGNAVSGIGTQGNPVVLDPDSDVTETEGDDIRICLLCKAAFQPDKPSLRDDNMYICAECTKSLEDDEENRRDCVACEQQFPVETLVSFTECSHQPETCTECCASWIAAQLDNKTWNEIICPTTECMARLQHHEVQKYASPEVFERFDALSIRSLLNDIPDFLWCPGPGCQSGQIHDGGNEGNIFRCVACRIRVCTIHDSTWNEGGGCQECAQKMEKESGQQKGEEEQARKLQEKESDQQKEDEEEQARKLQEKELAEKKKLQNEASAKEIEKISKKCPGQGCGWRIEKINGCDHMTCRKCWHEFCWLCLAPFDDIRRSGNEAHKDNCRYHSGRLPEYVP